MAVAGTTTVRGRRRNIRPWLRALNIASALVLAMFWWNLYRPQLVGGPAGYAQVQGKSMESTLVDGDLVITREHDSYHVGEIIAYRVPYGFPQAGVGVIHRIVGGSADAGYITRGDNRDDIDPWRPTAREVIGSVALRIPFAGSLVGFLRRPPVFAWLVGSIALVALWALDRRRRSAVVPG